MQLLLNICPKIVRGVLVKCRVWYTTSPSSYAEQAHLSIQLSKLQSLTAADAIAPPATLVVLDRSFGQAAIAYSQQVLPVPKTSVKDLLVLVDL